MSDIDPRAVRRAADLVADLVAQPEVATGWSHESSCAGMSVGGLAWHLARQPEHVVGLVSADQDPHSGAETITLLDHYARADWVREDHDGEANRWVRDDADRTAAERGPDDAIAVARSAATSIESVLAVAGPTTFVPWQGWSLSTDDFLATRLMEMVVHSDDLAVSVGLPVPDFGEAVLRPVLGLLTGVALRRHGQDALVRALSRPERAPGGVSAF